MADTEKVLRKAYSRRERDRNELFAGLRVNKKDVKRVFDIVYNRGALEERDPDLIADALFYTLMKINHAEQEELDMDLRYECNDNELD